MAENEEVVVNPNKGLSSLEEVKNRGKILSFEDSILRPWVKIVTFADGTQANINEATFNLLNKKKL